MASSSPLVRGSGASGAGEARLSSGSGRGIGHLGGRGRREEWEEKRLGLFWAGRAGKRGQERKPLGDREWAPSPLPGLPIVPVCLGLSDFAAKTPTSQKIPQS